MGRERIVIEITAKGARVVKGQIEDVAVATDKATTSAGLLQKQLRRLGVALVVRELINLGDTMTVLSNKIAVVTDTTLEAATAQKALFDIAREARAPIAQVATLFQRFSFATKDLGISQERVINLTRTLVKAVNIVGASSQESTGALIQLAQGLGAGTLRGQELNSVLEQAPVVAQAIAKQFGVTAAKLKVLGAAGKITSEELLNALEGAAEQIAEDFELTSATVTQSLTVIKNAAVQSLGQALQPLVSSLAQVFLFLADNVLPIVGFAFKAIIETVKTLAIVFGPLVLVAAITAATRAVLVFVSGGGLIRLQFLIGATISILKSFAAAWLIALGPISLFVAAVTAVIGIMSLLAPSFKLTEKQLKTLQKEGESFGNVFRQAANGVDATQEALDDLNAQFRLFSTFSTQAGREAFLLSKKIEGLKDPTGKFAKEIQKLEDAFDPLSKAEREFTELQEKLNLAVKAGVLNSKRAFVIEDKRRQALFDLQAPAFKQIETLKKRIALQRLTARERKIQIGLIDAQTAAGGRLQASQLKEIESLLRLLSSFEKTSGGVSKFRSRIQELNDTFAPGEKLVRDFSKAQDDLTKAVKRGILTNERALAIGDQLGQQLVDNLAPGAKIIAQLDQEIALLKLTSKEREIQTALLKFEKEAISGLIPDRRETISLRLREIQAIQEEQAALKKLEEQRRKEALAATAAAEQRALDPLLAQVQAIEDQAKAFASIKETILKDLQDPFAQLAVKMQALNELFREGKISAEQLALGIAQIGKEAAGINAAAATEKLGQIGKELVALEKSFTSQALRGGIDAVADQIVNFATTGKFAVKDMVRSIIADLTRLAARRLVLNAAVSLGLGGFRHGGSFLVGGNGGPDSQLVAFRATPNERVTVETPAQQRGGQSSEGGGGGGQEIRIINAVGVDALANALESPEGARMIANVISANADEFRTLINN